ncbi:SLOG family protein [uncultured Oscillibacter sp.]|uniref:SLOG family protein n=1 Tax=uncultured Oscillibacter sp. TaxID=876091 RepID=UPI0026079F68|nr:SLOG family protein [uncultured Oscillibacter sp.]
MSKRNSAWTQGHISCAFTGHRPHKFPWKDNEADPRCIALKETLAEQIAMLARAGVTEYFTGGADGVDCWAAEIVLTMREKNPALKLHCLLPHKGQADRWSDSAQERYHSILERANSVDYVSRQYYDGCMIDRNHRLVESAGLLLAVFNGVRRSGTGATVNYARKMGKEIIVIDPITRQVTREKIAQLPTQP